MQNTSGYASGEDVQPLSGALQSKNVRIHDRRTSVRLEPAMWSALNEVAELEGCTIHEICGAVHDLKEKRTSFTAALRVFLMEYYRNVSRSSVQVSQVQRLVRAARAQNRGKTDQEA
jgi:predicted DNA-binding ribbon-helix-helix protein